MLPYYELIKENVRILHRNESVYYPPHFHRKIEITYCFSGKQIIKVGGTLHTLTDGDAIVIFPNMIHENISCDEVPTETVTILCNAELVWQNMPQIKGMLPEAPVIPSQNISEETAATFGKIVTAENNLSQIGYIYIALSDLLNSLTLRKLNYNDDENISQRVIEYIAANFKESITLETLSAELGISKSYLSHVFSEQLNIHFRTYLGAVRAEHCAELMRTTSKSLTEIAFEGGFESQRSFNRVFKEHFGVSPSEYKKGLLH